MAGKYCYVNPNPFPVILPCPRGGNVTIKPGESTTNDWYGRFCGPKQLVRKLIGAPVAPKEAAPVPSQVALSFQPRPLDIVDKDTERYSMRRGIYHCKLCDIFRTGSYASLQAHFNDYHGMTDADLTAEPTTVSTMPKVTVQAPKEADTDTALRTVADTTPSEYDEPLVETSQPLVETGKPEIVVVEPEHTVPRYQRMPGGPRVREPVEGEEGVVMCDFPGCGRKFRTEQGLKIHKTRFHAK